MSKMRAKIIEERTPDAVLRTVYYWGGLGAPGEVWWRTSGDVLPSPLSCHDMAVAALVFPAMRCGCDLHIEGPVSGSLLAGMEEFQFAWTKWRPRQYRRINISADQVVWKSNVSDPSAVAAFSGGVDATFSLWRHHKEAAGHANRKIAGAILVHGLDIPLSHGAAFERAARTAREVLSPIGIPLALIETNWRSVCADWEMEFGAGLVACLRQFQGSTGAGIIGSDEDYAHLVTPWGSNPITNPLLSSEDFQVLYDGGGFSRTEKVAFIADWGSAIDRLRVCWEGPVTGQNCGICEKCIRTKLNFLAAGIPLPNSLLGEPTLRQIRGINARNSVQISYLEDIVAVAQANAIDAPWVSAVQGVVRKRRLVSGMLGLARISGCDHRLKQLRTVLRSLRARSSRGGLV